MGVLVNRRPTTILASLVTLLIIGLNVFLLYEILWAGG
jgi:Mn2+/Fe2+ NRAMP family transporter